MFTSNTVLLQRLEALDKQWNDVNEEIQKRIKEKRADNDGYIINEGSSGKYSLVSKEYYISTVIDMVNHANAKLNACKCKE